MASIIHGVSKLALRQSRVVPSLMANVIRRSAIMPGISRSPFESDVVVNCGLYGS